MADTFSFELFSADEIDSHIESLPSSTLIDHTQAKRDERFESLHVPLYTVKSAFELLDTKMPHIAKRIREAQSNGSEYRVIEELILNSRDGSGENNLRLKHGFPKDVYTALLFLHAQSASQIL